MRWDRARTLPGSNTTREARTGFGWVFARAGRFRLEKRMPLPGGVAMSVTADVRGRTMRLLVVDGKSNPFQSRLPFLRAIAQICREAAGEGRPFDAVAGDFNTPSRSIGFDALTAQGYTLASRSAAGWRGTFPSWLPIYDIDHVWLRPGLRHAVLHALQRSGLGPSRAVCQRYCWRRRKRLPMRLGNDVDVPRPSNRHSLILVRLCDRRAGLFRETLAFGRRTAAFARP